MTCMQAKESMPTVWQGAEAPELRQHLATCAECSAEMAFLGRLWDRLGDMPSPEFGTRISSRRLFAVRLWPRSPVWQVAVAAGCLAAGILIGTALPRQNKEIAKLHEEIASTRELVALSLLQQQSATERLRGVNYTGRMQTMEPEVLSALTEAVAHDPSVNVRLAALDALSNAALSNAPNRTGVLQSLTQSLPRQDSPMVQAALIDYLVDARDRKAIGTLRQLAAQPDLNPSVLERTRFAVQQLSQ